MEDEAFTSNKNRKDIFVNILTKYLSFDDLQSFSNSSWIKNIDFSKIQPSLSKAFRALYIAYEFDYLNKLINIYEANQDEKAKLMIEFKQWSYFDDNLVFDINYAFSNVYDTFVEKQNKVVNTVNTIKSIVSDVVGGIISLFDD